MAYNPLEKMKVSLFLLADDTDLAEDTKDNQQNNIAQSSQLHEKKRSFKVERKKYKRAACCRDGDNYLPLLKRCKKGFVKVFTFQQHAR